MRAAGALRARGRRDHGGDARGRAPRARARGRARHRPVQVVSGHARARPGLPLAPARPDRVGRAADRPRARDEVPLLRRPAPEQARLGAAPVPAGVRARPNRSGPVQRRTSRPGVAALGPQPGPDRARRGEAALRNVAQRRRADRALDRARGGGAAPPAPGAAATGTTVTATSSSPSAGSTARSGTTSCSRRPRSIPHCAS